MGASIDVHCQRKRVPCLAQGHAVVYPGHFQGRSADGRVFTKAVRSLTALEPPRQLQPTVILSGTKAKKHARGGEVAYIQYIKHLEKTSSFVKAATTAGTVENFAQGYQDYLQAPLQVWPFGLLLPLCPGSAGSVLAAHG